MKKILTATLSLMVACCTFLTMALPVSACTPSSAREITGDETSGIITQSGIFTYELSAEKDCYYITDCLETASGEIIIPSTYKELPVTRLGATTFENCEKITSVQIPETITEVLCNTFYGCTALESVNLPSTIQYIGFSAFQGCSSLKGFTINNESSGKGNSFTQNINGTSYKSYYYVDGGVLFLNTDIYIAKNLKYRPLNHNSLIKYPSAKPEKDYTIPDGTNEIWTDAFSSLKRLESVTVPSSVTSLYSQCFHGYGNSHEKPLTVIFQHNSFTGDLLTGYAFYDMPVGSKFVVETEEIKKTIEDLSPSFATLSGTDEKIAIEVNLKIPTEPPIVETQPVEPPEVEKNIMSYLLEIIMLIFKNYIGVFN